jgi:hypothetical protein
LFNFSSLIEEPTTISEYFNPINNVASSVTTTDDETNVENVQLQNFEDENIQNLINILASTTTSKPGTTTTKEPSANAYTTSPNIEESTLTPDEADILEILGQPTTSEPATTTTTTETPTTIRITAKEQARMCLFHGICDINQIQKFAKSGKPTVATTATTTTTTTTTLRSTTVATATAKSPGGSGFALLAQIQRCIQTPEHCNTNLIPMKKSNAAAAAPSTTTTRSTTTTTASTTLDPLEIARYFLF